MAQINQPTITLSLDEASALSTFLISAQPFPDYVKMLRKNAESGSEYMKHHGIEADTLVSIAKAVHKVRGLSFPSLEVHEAAVKHKSLTP